jgi:hypothetical protein
LNVSGFGNEDRLDVGLVIDPIAISDPEGLVDCVKAAFAGFVSGSGGSPVEAPSGSTSPTAAAE